MELFLLFYILFGLFSAVFIYHINLDWLEKLPGDASFIKTWSMTLISMGCWWAYVYGAIWHLMPWEV